MTVNVMNRTTAKLKQKISTSETFKEEYEALIHFYLSKFTHTNELNQDQLGIFLRELELLLARQFQQGYMVIDLYHEDNKEIPLIVEDMTFVDVINSIPKQIIDLYTAPNLDCTYVEATDNFSMEKLTEHGTIFYDKLQQVFKEITYYGMVYACLDAYPEKVIHEIVPNLEQIILPQYLTPQIFMVPMTIENTVGVTNIELFTYNFPEQETQWRGRFRISTTNDNAPLAEIYLSDALALFEKNNIIQALTNLVEYPSIHVNLYHVSKVQATIIEK